MADFELCEPFGIDDGELDGLTNTKCFVLGVEWAQVRKLVDDYLDGRILGFAKPVHAMNHDRLQALLDRHKVPGLIKLMDDDWDWIEVGDTPDGDDS